ncbi:MAG: type II restriction endonuclease [archaeon]|nr:type II restriction endonuclease [archaeon]
MIENKDNFREKLLEYLNQYLCEIQDSDGNWTVKGFIDIFKNIYTISLDTKVISKVLEIMLFPKIQQFAIENNFDILLSKEQNFYPDISFINKNNGAKIALDIKSTYRTSKTTASGFPLGAFTGYFRDRTSKKSITFPYGEYKKHYVLGIIYTKQDERIDEYKIYSLADLKRILSVIKDIEFILQEKYKIAIDRPGSGNTKNMGSTTKIEQMRDGTGIFSEYGIDVFDDYWMYYMTNDMAHQVELLKPPYRNIKEYFEYKKR